MAEPDVSARFQELVRWLLDRDGEYGAKKRVAALLNIHPSDISKILRGDRRVGWDLAMRAATSVGLDPAYFHGTEKPSEYIGTAASWANAAADARKSWRSPPPPYVAESLADLRRSALATGEYFERGSVDLLDVVLLAQRVIASPLYVGARVFLAAYDAQSEAAEKAVALRSDPASTREDRAKAEHEFSLAHNKAVVAAGGFLAHAKVAGLERKGSDSDT